MVVLECVVEIQQDKAVQDLLRAFALATGYRISQQVIRLQNAWCSRRDRWFCVLSAPVLGLCQLYDLPVLDSFQVVRHVMPCIRQWPEFDHAQLQLNLYELSKFHAYASGGIENMYLKLDGKCPTLLHSAGNQLYTCACGCRAAFSEQRLKSRGLFGVLVPLDTSQIHMNQVMTHCRYLHPQEMWALMGGIPGIPTGHNLRLAMAGIGQAVSPLVGVWVLSQVKQHVDKFFARPCRCDPQGVLKQYMTDLAQVCAEWWPQPIPPTVPDPEVDVFAHDPIEDVIPNMVIHVQWNLPASSPVAVVCPVGTTGQQVLEAEQVLTTSCCDLELRCGLQAVDLSLAVESGTVLTIGPVGSFVSPQVAPEICPLTVQDVMPSVPQDPGHDWNVYAISTVHELQKGPVRIASPRFERQAILHMQGPIWSDDELLLGLELVAQNTDADQAVHVWDPLLISGLVTASNATTWKALVDGLPSVATVVTAIALEQHWYPLVWRLDEAGSKLFTCGVPVGRRAVLDFLARIVGLHRGVGASERNNKELGFEPTRHCGAPGSSFCASPCVGSRVALHSGSNRSSGSTTSA